MPKVTLSTYSLFLKKNYQEAMQFAVEHGFQGIEIWSNVFDFWPKTVSAREIDAINTLARDNNISLAMHFCGGNNLADINSGKDHPYSIDSVNRSKPLTMRSKEISYSFLKFLFL